ncbi:MAG: glutathione S-transferase family protein [Thermoleophilia bacterium]|nr:glutathione S-transferase family protein [Thermoleophilia bacterium]
MLCLYQITGSSSFAARAALEEVGADYEVVNVHPKQRDLDPSFAEVNPLQRVPALRDGDAMVYETGAALLYIADRFPAAGLIPAIGDPRRPDVYRWVMWTANTLHSAWWPLMMPSFMTTEESGAIGIRQRGITNMAKHGAYLDGQLMGKEWCLGDQFTIADIYLYMLVGWQSFVDDVQVGGAPVQEHFARVGARPAIARARELDDLTPDFQRNHSDMRGGELI